MRHIYLAYLILFSLLSSGCATNSMTGRTQLSLVSEKSVMDRSASMYTSMVGNFHKDGKIVNDEQLNQRVQLITNRLVERALEYRPETKDWKWQVHVIEDDAINAFCFPGGKMGIYTGLINKVQPTDDELAHVMGHEISHALANHGVEKMSNQIIGSILVATVAVAAGSSNNSRQNQRLATDGATLAAAAFISLPNSRSAETEADKLGIELAAQAGFDPAASVSLWKKMSEATGNKSKGDFWSTHPSPPNRIEALQALQEPMNEIYAERKLAYADGYKPTQYYVVTGSDPIAASSNVRVLSPDTSSSFAENKEPLKTSKAKAFYSPEFVAFKTGKLELTCTNCNMRFFMNQSSLKTLHEKEDWRGIFQQISKMNQKLDLAYLYLGFAAEGLDFKEAAKVYFGKAAELSEDVNYSCANAKMLKCGNFNVQEVSSEKLNLLSKTIP